MKTFQASARQGDVIIVQVPSIPQNLVEVPREHGKVVLAHGEVTGHMHAISEKHVSQFRASVETPLSGEFKLRAGGLAGFTYLKVEQAPVHLLHEEHETIEIPPGLYEIRRQREYQRGAIKNVAD